MHAMRRRLAIGVCAAMLGGCAQVGLLSGGDWAPDYPLLKKPERPTGSNIARYKRNPELEGWRQGMDRDEMAKMQRSGGSRPGPGMGGG